MDADSGGTYDLSMKKGIPRFTHMDAMCCHVGSVGRRAEEVGRPWVWAAPPGPRLSVATYKVEKSITGRYAKVPVRSLLGFVWIRVNRCSRPGPYLWRN